MSPLRYPGSKQKAIKHIMPFWKMVMGNTKEYREPFLGGGSIFFNLDVQNKKIYLNDKDENIAILFKVMRDKPEKLCEKIRETFPTIEKWKEIKYSDPEDEIEIAFRTLFLNRTNYSGILSASPIGGFRQTSDYPIHCRWNPIDLQKRVKICSEILKNAEITSEDFFYSIIKPSTGEVFMFIDPPYYEKGHMLYNERMEPEDHERLRDLLADTKHKFLLTYDDCNEIRDLYENVPGFHLLKRNWSYTASTTKEKRTVGKELFITNIEQAKEYIEVINSEQMSLK
jgi:DNA adenine methylase